jgi:hypothetical protein
VGKLNKIKESIMKEPTESVKAFLEGRADLSQRQISLRIVAGEYRVCPRGSGEEAAYYTGDLADAIGTGRLMAENQRQKEPPLGPTGRRNSRKAIMYRHNAKIAAQRRARGRI